MISLAVSRLYEAKEKNGRRLPHRLMSEVLQGLLGNGAKATRDSLNYLLKNYVKPAAISTEAPARAPLSVIDVNSNLQSNISSLDGVEGVENAMTANDVTTNTNPNKSGRPKGSTRENATKVKARNRQCVYEITKVYQDKMNEVRAAGRQRVTGNYLAKLIREKKRANGVPDSYYIAEKTIINRIKKRRLDPSHPGVSSPLAAAKEVLVQICIMMGNVRQPLTPTEGVQLMNSLIKDRDLQTDLVEFKKKRRDLGQSHYPERLDEVG